MNIAGICTLVRGKFDNYLLLEFRIHRKITSLNVQDAQMRFCERYGEDSKNQEMVHNFGGCRKVEFIAVGGTQNQKIASMDPFGIP
jgi:hypothetical protein